MLQIRTHANSERAGVLMESNSKINIPTFNARILDINSRRQLERYLQVTGADAPGVQVMLNKADYYHIYLQNVNLRAANIIKQEMLSKGGDASVHKDISMLKTEQTDILLFGSYRQFQKVIKNFKRQPFGLQLLAVELEKLFAGRKLTKAIERQQALNKNEKNSYFSSNKYSNLQEKINLPIGERTIVMGILNVTPDSFSDGGKYNQLEIALAHAKKMVADGADIIDVGGESTRPGAEALGLEAELERILPIITALRKELPQSIISIDTYKAAVADAAVQAGANIINDVWGAKKDKQMAAVMAKHQLPVILMHNRIQPVYQDLIADIVADMRKSIATVEAAGLAPDLVILDPGIGFAKDYQQNLEIMYKLREITMLGYPVLLGTSRKSIIAKTLELPVNERIEGTAATVTLGIERGVQMVRVHDVKEMKRVCQMSDAMIRR